MASYYVYSGAGGAGTGADWANAYTTMAAALSGKAAGDVFYVADDHSESTAAGVTWTFPGTNDNPNVVLCVLRSGGSVPPVAADLRTTAVAATSGNSTISIGGSFYIYGVQVRCGVSSASSPAIQINAGTSGNPRLQVFDSCLLEIAATGTNGRIGNSDNGNIGSRGQHVTLTNTPLKFGAVGQAFEICGCLFEWRDTASAIQGSVPTTLFLTSSSSDKDTQYVIRGVDLSAAGSGKNLVSIIGTLKHSFLFENCKLGSSVTIVTGTSVGFAGPVVRLVNCDSADTNYRYQWSGYAGTITQETTIVRSGGASDGTTSISRKMVSGSGVRFYRPLVFDVMFWNETLSALSLAAEVVSDGVTFTDAELWMEVEALTNTGFPYSSFTKDRAATYLTTGTNQTSSSETWTTTGLSSPTKQKLEVSVTPAEKGWIRCRIYLAKASSTVYVCPLITGLGFTSGRQWQAADAYVIEGAGGSGGGARGSLLRGLVG